MTIELASTRTVEKPWGRTDLRPWSEAGRANGKIGEIWYERSDPAANEPSLLLKLLFTSEPLSVQVHRGDAFARSIGEARGKSEAWYILSAESGGRIALRPRPAADFGTTPRGHCRRIDRQSGSPRGQSRVAMSSMFRSLHSRHRAPVRDRRSPDSAATRPFVFSIMGDPARCTSSRLSRSPMPGSALAASLPQALGPGRTLLVSSPHFVLEKIDALPRSEVECPGAARDLAAPPTRPRPRRTAEFVPGRGGLPRG